ncbi:MAG: hypothetical protein RR969_13515 [Thermomonas sp.]
MPSVTVGSDRDPALRVLFVGNSYLYVNDLPSQVRRMAASRGVALDVRMLAQPDFALSDHLRTPDFLRALDRDWDWIVLQQGPSSLPESRDELIASVGAVAARVQGKRVRIALMSGWPAKQHAARSSQGEVSYRLAATQIGACVMPVATAWRLVRESDTPTTLYAQDRLHATRAGTRLAAMVVLHGLAGAGPLPAMDDRSDNPAKPKRVDVLEQAVTRAYDVEPKGCGQD